MIKYDWAALNDLPSNYIISILVLLEYGDLINSAPRILYERVAKFKDKHSFILNIRDLTLSQKSHTVSELYVYLELASLRSYIEYKATGKKSLPTIYLPEKYSLEKLKMNTALEVTEDEIFFKYEELI